MKLITAALFLLMSTQAFSFWGQDACENPLTETDTLLVCSQAAAPVMAKGNILKPAVIPFQTLEHFSFGYPDDMTKVIYLYDKAVYSPAQKLLGYLEIMAIANTEAQYRTELRVFYSVKGKVLGATAKDF